MANYCRAGIKSLRGTIFLGKKRVFEWSGVSRNIQIQIEGARVLYSLAWARWHPFITVLLPSSPPLFPFSFFSLYLHNFFACYVSLLLLSHSPLPIFSSTLLLLLSFPSLPFFSSILLLLSFCYLLFLFYSSILHLLCFSSHSFPFSSSNFLLHPSLPPLFLLSYFSLLLLHSLTPTCLLSFFPILLFQSSPLPFFSSSLSLPFLSAPPFFSSSLSVLFLSSSPT